MLEARGPYLLDVIVTNQERLLKTEGDGRQAY